MTPDDPPVPDDDALAVAARGALGRLAGSGGEPATWDEVRARGRRVQLTRYAAAAAASLLIVLAAAGTVSAVNSGGDHVDVAGVDPGGSTTTTASTTSTTSTTTTTTAPRTAGPPPIGPPAVGATTLPPTPGPSPQTVDFDGTIVVGSESSPVTSVTVGDSVDVTTMIRNISNRAIWASS